MANNCQVPTPSKYVNELLDYIGYKCQLYPKSVLENSCGEGNILKEIVRRYITNSREEGYSNEQIIYGLENYITGYDIDSMCVNNCIKNLDALAAEYGLFGIHWNICQQDYLKCTPGCYDYIIGNPPYITYHDLSKEQRAFAKEQYTTCKEGRFDYCYAFIEAALRDLSDCGKLAYLIPYGVIRNKHAKAIRNVLIRDLDGIVDYKGIQLFPNTVTSSVAILCNKHSKNCIDYYGIKDRIQKKIPKSLLGEKWIFEDKSIGQRRFGDYFKVANSVATLYNEAFVFEAKSEDEIYYYLEGGKIEKQIVFDAASTKSEKKFAKEQKRDKIIFPYKMVNGNILSYDENDFKCSFPACYNYLKKYQKNLLDRKFSKGVQWFEYGRVQAINNIFVDKLIMSVVITKKVNVYQVGSEAIPYAGIYIKALKDDEVGLDKAKEILQSNLFYDYIKKCGTPTTTSSYRISVKDIENYYF